MIHRNTAKATIKKISSTTRTRVKNIISKNSVVIW